MENINLDSSKLSMLILDGYTARTQSFVCKAIRAWDKEGEGCFYLFIKDYVNELWEDYAGRN